MEDDSLPTKPANFCKKCYKVFYTRNGQIVAPPSRCIIHSNDDSQAPSNQEEEEEDEEREDEEMEEDEEIVNWDLADKIHFHLWNVINQNFVVICDNTGISFVP